MHDSGRVRRREATRNLRRDVERLAQSELGPTQHLPVNEFADVSIADVVLRLLPQCRRFEN
jgi:hypothetical protein